MNSTEPPPLSRRALWGAILVFEGGLGLAAIGLGWLTGDDPRHLLRGGPVDLAWGVTAALGLLVVFGAMQRSCWAPLVALRNQVQEMVRVFFGRATSLDLLCAAVAAGIGEELFFRGWLLPFLGRFLGTAGGLLGSSLLFGLAHPFSRTYFVLATGIGALLGWIWVQTGSLVGPIVAHALYDLIVLCWIRRSMPKIPGREPERIAFEEGDLD